jgi:hypothetical protein
LYNTDGKREQVVEYNNMGGRGKQNGGIFLELLADKNSTAAHIIVCNMKAEPFFFY